MGEQEFRLPSVSVPEQESRIVGFGDSEDRELEFFVHAGSGIRRV